MRLSAGISIKDVLWVIFFFAISTATWRYASDNAERYGWLLADFTCACLLLRYQSQFINLMLSNLVFMSWPLIACISTVWSVAPGFTLYSGLQLLATTLVAFLICIQLRLVRIVKIVFWGMLLAAVLALATAIVFPGTGIDYVGNWRGGFPTKNVMGDAMVLLVISGSCLFLQGRMPVITALGVALGIFLIFETRSATPILSVVMTLLPLPYAYALLRGRTPFMILIGATLVFGALVVIGGYVAVAYWNVDPISLVLSSVGKDRTLTGRTLLWDLAQRAIDESPWLGLGFNGYWANPPAAMLQVRAAFGQPITFFHNNFLEVTVAYGVIGPILLALGILVAGVRSVRRVLTAVQPIDIWPLLIIVQVTIQTLVQYPLMVNHSLWHVIFIVAAIARR